MAITDTAQRPNVLFILADQWRGQALGCAGDPNVRTPHLDRLAAEGILVSNSFTTDPVCTPARAALLTGRYPHTTGAVQNNIQLPEEEITFAEILRDRGYATGYIGKWHLDGPEFPGFVPPGPRRQGFEYWAGFNRGHRYWDSSYYRDSAEPVPHAGYEPDYQTDLALEFIRDNAQRPFCLFLAWGPPHTPLNPPEKYRQIYNPGALEIRSNVPAEEELQAREELAGYYGHCTALDANVGRLLDALEQMNIADSTLIIFTSDHGDLLGSHGLYRKGSFLEESIRVPLLLRWPGGLPAGHRPAVLASSVDIAPTLLGLCGAPAPENVQGHDLSAQLKERGVADGPHAVYLEGRIGSPEEWRAIRTAQQVLAVRVDGTPTHLFDLEADPYQQVNLVNTSAASAMQSALLAELHMHSERFDDHQFLRTPV